MVAGSCESSGLPYIQRFVRQTKFGEWISSSLYRKLCVIAHSYGNVLSKSQIKSWISNDILYKTIFHISILVLLLKYVFREPFILE